MLLFKSMGNGSSSFGEKDGISTVIEVFVTTIDSVLNGGRADFIKMDIEGAELEAIKGAKNTIQKYHPQLAISVYHKTEDILELPKLILEYNPRYKLYLRHYSITDSETVLYAIDNAV